MWYQGDLSPYNWNQSEVSINKPIRGQYQYLEVVHVLQVSGDLVICRVDDRLVQVDQEDELPPGQQPVLVLLTNEKRVLIKLTNTRRV